MSQTLLEMAKDLVLASMEAHRLSPEEMHQALQYTYASLQALSSCLEITFTNSLPMLD